MNPVENSPQSNKTGTPPLCVDNMNPVENSPQSHKTGPVVSPMALSDVSVDEVLESTFVFRTGPSEQHHVVENEEALPPESPSHCDDDSRQTACELRGKMNGDFEKSTGDGVEDNNSEGGVERNNGNGIALQCGESSEEDKGNEYLEDKTSETTEFLKCEKEVAGEQEKGGVVVCDMVERNPPNLDFAELSFAEGENATIALNATDWSECEKDTVVEAIEDGGGVHDKVESSRVDFNCDGTSSGKDKTRTTTTNTIELVKPEERTVEEEEEEEEGNGGVCGTLENSADIDYGGISPLEKENAVTIATISTSSATDLVKSEKLVSMLVEEVEEEEKVEEEEERVEEEEEKVEEEEEAEEEKEEEAGGERHTVENSSSEGSSVYGSVVDSSSEDLEDVPDTTPADDCDSGRLRTGGGGGSVDGGVVMVVSGDPEEGTLCSRDSSVRSSSPPSPVPDGVASDDEDFFDALDHQVEQEFEVALPHSKDKLHRRSGSDFSMDTYANDMSSESESEGSVNEARVYTTKANSPKKLLRHGSGKRDHKRQASQDKIRVQKASIQSLPADVQASSDLVQRRKRRKWITEKPNISLNLWSVMKNCIGKELSKIPMPVNFSEPLSMLQRLTEELEYSEILDQAAMCEDSCEQLAYVAAFTVSAYATTLFRTGKPFNPLLGETFEFDRTEDMGWRSLAEQVSHHPPTLATHAEGRGWTLWQEFTMTTKFRGRYLQIIPMGIAHLTFSKSGGHYTWRKVTTTVHNIIVGRLWVDNQGEMDITNHTSGDKCHLKYSAYSYFSREPPRKVTGVVTDSKENARWVLTGNWCTKMEGAPIIHVEESNKGKPVFETGPHKLLWKVRPPPHGAEKIYFFSQLAIEMNEPEEGVAPTDSRLRPDQRLMEEGKWDEANRLKFLLEEKQRAARRQREAEAEKLKSQGLENRVYQPTWFRKEMDQVTGNLLHVFTGKYWDSKSKRQWEICPDIYL